MFGYIKPLEAQLRVCELDAYRAVYCGLCRSLSRRFGPFARFSLSYDFTFIAMLYASLQEDPPSFVPQRCPYNPIKTRPHLNDCAASDFACDTAAILLNDKFLDNGQDEPFLPSVFWRGASLLLSDPAARRAAGRLPEAADISEKMMRQQSEVELNAEASVDAACHPTATALSELLMLLPGSQQELRVLSRLGYMLGRYIYLCDAVDDLDKDLKSGNFNPLKTCETEEAGFILRGTIAEAAKAYCLLTPRHFKEVLDNIIFLGMPHEADRLLERRKRHE